MSSLGVVSSLAVYMIKSLADDCTFYQDPAAYVAAYEAANVGPAAPVDKKAKVQTQEGQEDSADFMTIGKGGKTLNLTSDGVFKTLKEIFEQRGRKVSVNFQIRWGKTWTDHFTTEHRSSGDHKNPIKTPRSLCHALPKNESPPSACPSPSRLFSKSRLDPP